MNVSVGERWERYIEELVKAGRYGSASEVVREGLRLVEEREEKLASLKATIDDAINRGGAHDSDDVLGHVRAHLDKRRAGKAAA